MVALVHRDDDGDLGRLGVRQGLQGLGHHTVIGRHDQDNDVGYIGSASPHGREGGVTRGVKEGQALQFTRVGMRILNRVGTNVLGDATGLT
jgi:hypothetical protein